MSGNLKIDSKSRNKKMFNDIITFDVLSEVNNKLFDKILNKLVVHNWHILRALKVIKLKK